MDNTMAGYAIDMKPLMRVSKYGVRSIIGKMLDYSAKYEYTYTLDTEKCSSCLHCPLADSYNALQNTICEEKAKEIPNISVVSEASKRMKEIASSCAASSCPFCHVTKTYVNDRKRYNMYNEDYANRRLPKSMIRTYLYLFALPQEVLGGVHFIRDLSISLLSSELGLCVETVRRSIETLTAFHYITISHASSSESYNIIINDYDTMHLPASQGGTGYFTITASMMKEILSISNVNALRLELLRLLKCDDDSLHNVQISEYNLKDLRNIMPGHMNYPANYEKIIKEQPSLFVADVINGKLHFFLKNGYSLRISSDEFMMEYKDELIDFINELGLVITSDTFINICELTREYSITNIKISLSMLYSDYGDSWDEIKNFGALLRSYCRKNFIRPAA